jgi:hypothetical protein
MRLSPAVERALETAVGAVLGIVGDYERRTVERTGEGHVPWHSG